MPETVSVTPDPAALPPVSSIDVKAAYRARVGPINRAILFVLFYLPLTFSYSVYAAFIFIDDVFRIGLIVAGVVGDLLRYRFAPDVNRDWASTVSVIRDGVWRDEVKRSYDRWYCGWEKPFLISIASYIAIFCIIRELLPANFKAYVDFFGPLHDLTRQTFVMARNHSNDLTNHGYEHLVGAVVHLEMLVALFIIVAPFLICIGGAKQLTKSACTQPVNPKKIAKWHENRTKMRRRVANTFLRCFLIFSVLVLLSVTLFIITKDISWNTKDISWNSCRRLRLCPQHSLTIFAIKIGAPLFVHWIAVAAAPSLRLWAVTMCIWDQQEAEAKGGLNV